ncbi:MAG: methyl-accepting chemotaxis protein, partial [Hydrogenophaga sp.]
MNWISMLSTRTKLALLLAVCSLGTATVATTALLGLRTTVNDAQALVQNEVAAVQELGDLRADVGNMRRFEKDMFLNLADETELNRYHEAWVKQVDAGLARLTGLQARLPAEELPTIEQFRSGLAGYRQAVEAIHVGISRGEINDPWRANKLLEPAKTNIRTADDALGSITRNVASRMEATVAQLARTKQWVFLVTLLAASGSIALAIALGLAISRRITKPIEAAAQGMARIAAGDLSTHIVPVGKDEVARMLAGMQTMQSSLSTLVKDVRDGIDAINTASVEIATGNQDLSARTEQTASNLQQTAASMEQLTSTVRQSADAARQANQLA